MTQTASHIPPLKIDGDFFGHFFNQNPSPMWIVDAATQYFLEVNKASVWIYGYSREEFLGMSVMDIRPPEDVAALENYLSAAGSTFSTETKWRHVKKDGTVIWVSISSFACVHKGMAARVVTVTDISKYQEQEKALNRASRDLNDYKMAITTSSLVSITNRRGIIEYANDNFLNLTGYSRDELVGHSHNIVNSGYHPSSFWQGMWNTIMNGNTWRGEVCNRKKNGGQYWVDSFVIPVKNSEGRIDRIFSITVDITERKNKESEVFTLNKQLVAINLELRESKKELEKLSLVAKLTASQVFMINSNREITWVNDAFTRQMGYTLAEAYGKLPEKLLHGPNSYQDATFAIKTAISNKEPFNTEVLHYTKSGKQVILLTDGQPVLDEQGNLLQYVIVETDITELKEKQQAIKSSEIKLNSFFNSTGNLHLLVDGNLRVLAFNKIAADFMRTAMGYNISEGDYLPEKLTQPSHDNFLQFAVKALNGETTIARQIELLMPAEGKKFFLVHYLPAYDSKGAIMGVAFTMIDITQLKKAEDKINERNALLKEIAWKQSHVVRAPVANILSLTSLLEDKTQDGVLYNALKHETNKLDEIIKGIVQDTIAIKNEE